MELDTQTRTASQSFLGSDSERILAGAKAGLIGLSGGGSHIALQLAHVSLGNFVVVDYDHVEEKNLNRMAGASARDAQRSTLKTKVIRRVIKRVNPKANVLMVSKKWQEGAELLRDCDVIFGCVDTFSERQQLETFARRYLIPYIDIGMDVHPADDGFSIGGQVVLSMPEEFCLRCCGIVTDERLAREAAEYGVAGGRPQVVWPNGVLASTAVGIFVQLLCPWRSPKGPGLLCEYDGDSHVLSISTKMKYLAGMRCKHFSDASGLGDPFWKP